MKTSPPPWSFDFREFLKERFPEMDWARLFHCLDLEIANIFFVGVVGEWRIGGVGLTFKSKYSLP